jgi:sterol 3beta-glucosyltransferase
LNGIDFFFERSFEKLIKGINMIITFLTTGTRGDLQPYIALCVELKKAGHRVRVAAFENYETFVKKFGLEYFPIKGDVSRIASSDDAKFAMKADNPIKLFFCFYELKSLVFDLQKDFFDACQGSDAIIYHPGASIGYFAAQYYEIPSILATPFPMTPTKEYPALIFYNGPRLGRKFNLFTHQIFEKVMWFASSSPVRQFWKQKFGLIPKDFGCPFGKQNTTILPTIISCSNYVFPRPKDWSDFIYCEGFWFLDDSVDWAPPKDLVEFLRNGTAPVYVGFGSVGDSALATQTTELVIKALKLSGQRGILSTGWNGMARIGDIPESIFILEDVPHSWLFPRMAAVVHHGGAGTTAAGLKAGVPNIVIPFSNDQFAWGRRVYELGVGSKPVPRRNLTKEKLSEAINISLMKEIKEAAKVMGMKIQSENGAESMAKIIIKCLKQK